MEDLSFYVFFVGYLMYLVESKWEKEDGKGNGENEYWDLIVIIVKTVVEDYGNAYYSHGYHYPE